MKRIVPPLLAMLVFLAACAGPAVTGPAPTQPAEASAESQPVQADTATPEPVQSPTPVPPPARWFWSVDDSEAPKVIAVNQFGERRELGALEKSDELHTAAVSLDPERALLFLDSNDTLRVYLLTPDGMQKIKLPDEPVYFNTEFSQTSRAVLTVHDQYAVFTYATRGAAQSQTSGAVDTGPVFLVDLNSLTASQIDPAGNQDPSDANRAWFHTSPDGRYLRYLNGNADSEKIEIRELDLVTGIARTLTTAKGPPARIYASPGGDLWYLRREGLILDLNGNQSGFTDSEKMFTPLSDGRGLVYSWDCVDVCEMKVIDPFGSEAELTYNMPWTIEGSTSYVNLRQVLPDQNLMFAGMPYVTLSNPPASVETYPGLQEGDIPLFRLAPDRQARLVGTYVEGNFTRNVSRDGRYILAQAIDKTSFFLYDAVADRPLFEMPIDPELVDPLVTLNFMDQGILAELSASVPGTKHSVYRSFRYAYDFKTSTVVNWEDVNLEIESCPGLLEDGSLICWFYRTDSNSIDLMRFDPASGKKTALLENVWLIDYSP